MQIDFTPFIGSQLCIRSAINANGSTSRRWIGVIATPAVFPLKYRVYATPNTDPLPRESTASSDPYRLLGNVDATGSSGAAKRPVWPQARRKKEGRHEVDQLTQCVQTRMTSKRTDHRQSRLPRYREVPVFE